MGHYTHFVFQMPLKPETPEPLLALLRGMLNPDATEEELDALAATVGESAFFQIARWKYLFAAGDVDFPPDAAPVTRMETEVDAQGNVVAHHIYGASSVKTTGWQMAKQFVGLVGRWLIVNEIADPLPVGTKLHPYMVMREDVEPTYQEGLVTMLIATPKAVLYCPAPGRTEDYNPHATYRNPSFTYIFTGKRDGR